MAWSVPVVLTADAETVTHTFTGLDDDTSYDVQASKDQAFDPASEILEATFVTPELTVASFTARAAVDIGLAFDTARSRILYRSETTRIDAYSYTGTHQGRVETVTDANEDTIAVYDNKLWVISQSGSLITFDIADDGTFSNRTTVLATGATGVTGFDITAGRIYIVYGRYMRVYGHDFTRHNSEEWSFPTDADVAGIRVAGDQVKMVDSSSDSVRVFALADGTEAAGAGYDLNAGNTNAQGYDILGEFEIVGDRDDDTVYVYRAGAYVPPAGTTAGAPRLASLTYGFDVDNVTRTYNAPNFHPETFDYTALRHGHLADGQFYAPVASAVDPTHVVTVAPDHGALILSGAQMTWTITVSDGMDSQEYTLTLGYFNDFDPGPPPLPPANMPTLTSIAAAADAAFAAALAPPFAAAIKTYNATVSGAAEGFDPAATALTVTVMPAADSQVASGGPYTDAALAVALTLSQIGDATRFHVRLDADHGIGDTYTVYSQFVETS